MTEEEARARVISSMCPARVCLTCGEPSRRRVADRSNFDRQPALAAHIKERRQAAGFTSAEINDWFGFKRIAENWERTDPSGARIPNLREWPILKERLGLSDDFDDLVTGDRRWTESEITYSHISDHASGTTQDNAGRVYQRFPVINSRIAPDRFSDCGHDDWRPGKWLDPFQKTEGEVMLTLGNIDE